MPTFTVHEPPPRKDESVTDPERFLFVRDGFYFWAFVLAPAWLVVRRLWLALLIYVVVTVALAIGLNFAGVSPAAQTFVALVMALVVGFEAATIRRWTLTRRSWKTLGFVVGEDLEIAERRFYAAWSEHGAPRSGSKPTPVELQYATPVRRGTPSPSDVIGLFPEPGGSR